MESWKSGSQMTRTIDLRHWAQRGDSVPRGRDGTSAALEGSVPMTVPLESGSAPGERACPSFVRSQSTVPRGGAVIRKPRQRDEGQRAAGAMFWLLASSRSGWARATGQGSASALPSTGRSDVEPRSNAPRLPRGAVAFAMRWRAPGSASAGMSEIHPDRLTSNRIKAQSELNRIEWGNHEKGKEARQIQVFIETTS